MQHVHLSGRLIDGDLIHRIDGWLIRCSVDEWDSCRRWAGDGVFMDTTTHRNMKLVIGWVVSWPAGEPWAWVWLSPVVVSESELLDELPAKKQGRRRKVG